MTFCGSGSGSGSGSGQNVMAPGGSGTGSGSGSLIFSITLKYTYSVSGPAGLLHGMHASSWAHAGLIMNSLMLKECTNGFDVGL